MNLFLTGTT